ncbi:O-antigen ligase family protein [Pseudomonas sp. NPDC007930]|uniref:O-antigen ligase family protein n=1 Tax=Pseudomonas sp. NPDC007930 TaxID=3364417 RepID=UPI0036E99AFF
MFSGVSTASLRDRSADFFERYLIPLGWLIILVSMFIAGDRNRVHQLFYVFLALPTAVLLVLRPALLRPLVMNPLFAAFAAFSVYTIITVAWAETDESWLSLAKRPLFIALLLFNSAIIALRSQRQLMQLTRWAAMVAALAAGVSLVYYLAVLVPSGAERLNGYGALYNPLLSAHVFGAFTAIWLATWLQGRRLIDPVALVCLAVLGLTVLATGSRTPLVGLAFALCWLMLAGERKRGLLVVAAAVFGFAVLVAIHPESVTQRGVSYRPQIWMEALRQISERPWLGYGYDTTMAVYLPDLDGHLADPHNMELGVLWSGGIVGLVLWIVLYAAALKFCWQNRKNPAVSLAAAWLIFGFGSGLTEGMAFLSRPKEHWFLIWLPMALIFGLLVEGDQVTPRPPKNQ